MWVAVVVGEKGGHRGNEGRTLSGLWVTEEIAHRRSSGTRRRCGRRDRQPERGRESGRGVRG